MSGEPWYGKLNNPYGEDKVMSACGVFGMLDTSGRAFAGGPVVTAMTNMNDRTNGLGAGFAVYGLYPQLADCYAIHVMYMSDEAVERVERLVHDAFTLVHHEEIPTRVVRAIAHPPRFRRYFVRVGDRDGAATEEDYVLERVQAINATEGSFVFSSGKNMGVFKGVGYPEQIAEFFRLEEYAGYLWTAHSRFPTNTPGWWGGAHPFSVLDWTVVHNGEISSYGANVAYLETQGYQCTMQTDTEVAAYAVDLLMRRHALPVEVAAKVLAPPFWDQIERETPERRQLLSTLRQVYGGLLLNGPFTIILAHRDEMIGLTDRIRLRPLTAATRGDVLYLSSEEASIRLVEPELDRVWTPMGGEPVIGKVRREAVREAA